MPEYCKISDILNGDHKLTSANVELALSEIVVRATDFVRNDLSGTVDIDSLEQGFIPDTVVMLTALKGKELAYISYYGINRPEQSEIEQYARDYDMRVKSLLDKVRRGELDSILARPSGERKTFRLI